RLCIDAIVAHLVRSGKAGCRMGGHDVAMGADKGAHVGDRSHVEGGDRSLSVGAHSYIEGAIAGMIDRAEMLDPVLDPAYRFAQPFRCEGNEEIFRIELAAGTEAASDIRFNHADFRFAH